MGRPSYLVDQQLNMSSHKGPETQVFGSSASGWSWHRTSAIHASKLERSKSGVSSVMHSSISIPNENVSEVVVARAFLSSMNSGAEHLIVPSGALLGVTPVVLSSTIPVIPKL